MTTVTGASGRGVPLRGNDIDTDRIIPARYLRCVTFDGIGQYAFEDDRKQLKEQGKLHPFDDARFAGGGVLLVNASFGCGSSREHAPQAIMRWGIKGLVGVSFAEIFFGNCVALGIPCVTLDPAAIEALQSAVEADPSLVVTIDVATLKVSAGPLSYTGKMPAAAQKQFLSGAWDATGELLAGLEQVKATAAKLPYFKNFAA